MSFRAKKIEYLSEKAKKIRELTVECIGRSWALAISEALPPSARHWRPCILIL